MKPTTLFTRATTTILHHPIRPDPVLKPIPTSVKPKTPLHLKPPKFTTTQTQLKSFKKWANNKAISINPNSTLSNNGLDLDSTLLQRELKWLLQDAIFQENDASVELRACLDELYEMWRERIDERKPFQYVVGCEHWRDLVLSVEEGVLIPRPETEMIVDFVENVVKMDEELGKGVWADLGTGSGALAIGVSRVLGLEGSMVAVDLSDVVVNVAEYNVERYKLKDRVSVRQGSWFEPLKDVEGELCGLVSNPPYIPSENISGLQAEVSKHEPRLALDGGTNGMDDLLHLCKGAASMLRPGGFFAFETNGETQCKFLVNYMDTEMRGSFEGLNIVSDFADIQRFVTGYRTRRVAEIL